MKITIESTTKIVELKTPTGTVPARLWEGHTELGTPVHCFITRICPTIQQPLPDAVEAEFQKDLADCKPPSPQLEGIPLRLIL